MEHRDALRMFVTEQDQLTPEVITLLKLDHLYDPQDDLTVVVEKTQAKWLAVRRGDPQKERSDLVDSPEQVAIRDDVVKVADRMGLFKAQDPLLQKYDYAVCLGAFLNGVRSRLAHIVELWQQGIRFESLVFLAGERTLRKGPGQVDDYAFFLDPTKSPLPFKPNWSPPPSDQVVYETEYDMVRLVWDQVQIPVDMELALKGHVIFVNAPRGIQARPSTKDTYQVWLDQFHPKPGSLVAPSDPLLWTYQQLTGMQVLGPEFNLDTIAHAPSPTLLKRYECSIVALILDTVATCLFRINEGKLNLTNQKESNSLALRHVKRLVPSPLIFPVKDYNQSRNICPKT